MGKDIVVSLVSKTSMFQDKFIVATVIALVLVFVSVGLVIDMKGDCK